MQEKKYTSGELTAIAAGKEVISQEQAAVAFLVAKYALNEKVPPFNPMPANDFSVAAGFKPVTFNREVNKFKLLLEGNEEDEMLTAKEAIDKKHRNNFSLFFEMNLSELLELAQEAFTEENERKGLAFLYDSKAAIESSNEKIKLREKQIASFLSITFSDYKKMFSREKAISITLQKAVEKFGISQIQAQNYWAKLKK